MARGTWRLTKPWQTPNTWKSEHGRQLSLIHIFTPVANPTFGSVLLAVRLLTSGITGSHGVTGGVYKARERIHRGMLIRDY